MNFKFGTMSIFELGQMISSKLKEDGITQKSELCVYLNEEEFRRVDEDLFYRNRRGDREDFVPSEGEIDINFEGVKIIIKVKS
jgi:hypothetical protein